MVWVQPDQPGIAFQRSLAWIGRLIGLLCLVLTSSLASAWISPAYANPTVEDLQRQQQQIDQQRSSVSQERSRLQNIQKAAEQYLTGLDHNIGMTDIQIRDVEYELKLAKQYLKDFQEDLAIASAKYQQQQSATVGRLQFLQRQKNRQGWALLLQSHNLNQFLDRRRQLKLVYQADRQSLASLKVQAEKIRQQRLNIEQQKNQIAILNQQLLAQRSAFAAQAQSQRELVQRLRQDRVALEAAEAQLTRDSESIRDLIQQQGGMPYGGERTPMVVRGSGRMMYPSVAEISSVFGWRMHPILGYQRFHSGVDFAADYGSTIRAAASGRVMMAGWYGGYGNTVILDHGGGITTLYGHASELLVAEGDVVQQGQPIASVGSTGLSTGPHLHFEVRENGEPVDPMSYL